MRTGLAGGNAMAFVISYGGAFHPFHRVNVRVKDGYRCSRMVLKSQQKQESVPDGTNPIVTDVVRKYFTAFGKQDVEDAMKYISKNMVYRDTLWPEPFEGIDGARACLEKSADLFPASWDLVMDSLSPGETKCVGRWHLESNGAVVPNSNGVSFWKCDSEGKLTLEYSITEPVVKTGEFRRAMRDWGSSSADEE